MKQFDESGRKNASLLIDAVTTAPYMKTPAAADPSEFSGDQDMVTTLLTEALKDSNPEVFLAALQKIAHDRGIGQLAQDAGVGRESLYKSLKPGAKPRYDTVIKLLNALGVKLCAISVHM